MGEVGASIEGEFGGDWQALIQDSIRYGASDIHLCSDAKSPTIRWRIHGQLTTPQVITPSDFHRLVSGLKLHANMDIATAWLPQDGYLDIPNGGYHARVGSLPTLYGEDMVIRLIPHQTRPLEGLGFESAITDCLRGWCQRRSGLIVLTGPTGSGKSSTLMALMDQMATHHRRMVISLEDPVEHVVPGVRQSPIHPPTGYTYASGLRAVLRLDPDVIVVGELRDADTARLTVEAAYTGHLVLSTLHTDSVRRSVTRLHQLGVESVWLEQVMGGILSQQLAPIPCSQCVGGCPNCHGLGITGRRATGELLDVPEGSSLAGFPTIIEPSLTWIHPSPTG